MRQQTDKIDLLRGTLDMLILRTLQWGPQHGHGIGLAIRNSSGNVLQVERGSLYPALHRLRKQGAPDANTTEELMSNSRESPADCCVRIDRH
jgi:DNA-binding PadR family transcriptional regulator